MCRPDVLARYCPCCYASGIGPRFITVQATHMLHDKMLSPFSSSARKDVFAEWWFQIFRGVIDYGPRMCVHMCVHVNLCWAEYVCARVSACVLVLAEDVHVCVGL